MEHTRKQKFLLVLALVVAIASVSVGFAAFSTTLNISSSAIVTPSSEDFKISIYGFKNPTLDSILKYEDDDLSDSYSTCILSSATCTTALIDNTNHTISNIKANFESVNGAVGYFFIIKNEGKYDAYIDLSNMMYSVGENNILGNMLNKSCVSKNNATPSLVEAACNGVNGYFFALDKETGEDVIITDDYYMIAAGDSELITLQIDYRGPLSDGPFDVEFEDFQFKFSTVK